MKKYLSIYTLLALACIVLQSCLFSEEEIFDESSANRATADVIKCQEILKDVPNGWKLEYYIGSNYSAGRPSERNGIRAEPGAGRSLRGGSLHGTGADQDRNVHKKKQSKEKRRPYAAENVPREK